jgi:hypothetical protein
MQLNHTRRLILDATIDRSVIRGTLTAPSGDRRDFHGWLELNTGLEAILASGADHPPTDSHAVRAAVPATARATRAAPPATNSINPPAGGPAPTPEQPTTKPPTPSQRGD